MIKRLFPAVPARFCLPAACLILLCACSRQIGPVPGQAGIVSHITPYPAGTAAEPAACFVIGSSVLGRPLTVKQTGEGRERAVILIGGIHGEEANTVSLVERLRDKYGNNPRLVPAYGTLFSLACMNPDGYAEKTRENHSRVDLNHNFPADDWQAAALNMTGQVIPGLGGSAPGSEPETRAAADWLLAVKQHYRTVWVLAFHSAAPPAGYIQPGYFKNGDPDPLSAELARRAAAAAGYRYLHAWVDKAPITGELIHFAVMNGMPAMDVELPVYDAPEVVPPGKKESTLASHERMLAALIALPLPGPVPD